MKIKLIIVLIFLVCITACSNVTTRGRILDLTEPEQRKLSVMVYMAADNDLESYALENLKAMERAEMSEIHVIVLLDRSDGYDETNGNWTDTRLFEVLHEESEGNLIRSKRLDSPLIGLSSEENTELDMANPSVLRNFVEFGKTNYPAEKYALIIWGHGTGWRYVPEWNSIEEYDGTRAVAIDDRTKTYMCVQDMGNAIRGQGLSVIGFDTCFGGVFENIYELKDCAEYTVACPGVTPSSGWNYKGLFENISASDFSSNQVAKEMAKSSSVSTTVFINSKLSELFTSFENFSRAIADSITDSNSRNSVFTKISSIKTYSYSQNPCDVYLDILSMSEQFASSSNLQITDTALQLKDSINETCLSVENGKVGLSVHYIQKTSSGAMDSKHSIDYVKDNSRTDQCEFIRDSQWWVPTLLQNSGSVLDKLFYINY